MKWPSKILQNLPYFWNKKTYIVFFVIHFCPMTRVNFFPNQILCSTSIVLNRNWRENYLKSLLNRFIKYSTDNWESATSWPLIVIQGLVPVSGWLGNSYSQIYRRSVTLKKVSNLVTNGDKLPRNIELFK